MMKCLSGILLVLICVSLLSCGEGQSSSGESATEHQQITQPKSGTEQGSTMDSIDTSDMAHPSLSQEVQNYVIENTDSTWPAEVSSEMMWTENKIKVHYERPHHGMEASDPWNYEVFVLRYEYYLEDKYVAHWQSFRESGNIISQSIDTMKLRGIPENYDQIKVFVESCILKRDQMSEQEFGQWYKSTYHKFESHRPMFPEASEVRQVNQDALLDLAEYLSNLGLEYRKGIKYQAKHSRPLPKLSSSE